MTTRGYPKRHILNGKLNGRKEEFTMKKTRGPVTMKNFILSKCIIGNGIINGAINAGIFYLLNMKHEGAFFSNSLYFDFALTTFILVLCMAALAFTSTSRAVKKGNAPALSCNGFHHSIGRVLPKNKWVLLSVVTIVLTAIVPAFFVGLVSGIGLTPISFTGAIILKGVTCAVVGGLSTYLFTVARLNSTTACVLPQSQLAAE